MPLLSFYLKMSRNINDKTFKILLCFHFLQISYGLTMKSKVQKLYTTRSTGKNKNEKEQTQKRYKSAIK